MFYDECVHHKGGRMSDVALTKAERKRLELQEKIVSLMNKLAEIQADLDALQKEKAKLDQFIDTWYELAGEPRPKTALAAAPATISISLTASARSKNPEREVVVEKALGYIRAVGHPLPRKEIFERLKADGVVIYGKDPEMVLSTMLWRSQDQIVRLRGFGYWPKDTPYDQAGYDPDIDDLVGSAETEPEGDVEVDDA